MIGKATVEFRMVVWADCVQPYWSVTCTVYVPATFTGSELVIDPLDQTYRLNIPEVTIKVDDPSHRNPGLVRTNGT
jgi:hypothetical protein